MADQLAVEIVTQQGLVYQGTVDSLVAPGVSGYFGTLPHHAPLIAELGVGELRLRTGTEWQQFALSGGIFHLAERRAVVMADAVEPVAGIDVARAREALRRARERLKESHQDPHIDVTRAQLALVRALNRLRVAGAPSIDR